MPRSRLARYAGLALLLLATALALASATFWPALAVAAPTGVAAWGLSLRRRPVRPRTPGFQDLGYGLLTLVLLAIGYRLEL